MNRLLTLTALAGLAALAAPAAVADTIYTWTDEDGVVHFGDRPSGVASERTIYIATERAGVPAPAVPRTPATAAGQQAAPEAATPQQTEEERRAAECERAEKCQMYKERLQSYLTARRLYRQDENGERVYLSEDEMLAARAEVQERIVEFCND